MQVIQKEKTSTLAKVQEDNPKYRLAISFISIGAGIDSKIYKKVDSFLVAQPKKLACVDQAWGKRRGI